MATSYTNAVLTVIALCLLVLVFQPFFDVKEASAQVALTTTTEESPTPPAALPTRVSNRDEVVKVNIVEIAGWKLLKRSALPVEIESGPVPVEIEGPGKVCGCP